MGKKLSYWEKSRRESEKRRQRAAGKARMESQKRETARRREAERVARAEASAKRKAADKRQREIKKIADQKFGKNSGENFMKLIDGLINYSKTLNSYRKKLPDAKSFSYPDNLKSFDYPGDLKSNQTQPILEEKSFVPNKAIIDLKNNVNMSYDVFKSKYGTFFGNLFGSTKKLYGPFVEDNKKKLDYIKEKEVKRKEDFKDSLNQYLDSLMKFNKLVIEKKDVDNIERKKRYKNVIKEIEKYNETKFTLVEKISKTFNSITAPDFESLFGMNLPIKFDLLNDLAKSLNNSINEIKSDFYDSPKNHFRYGTNVNGKELSLFLEYEEDFFPLPSNQQINIISSGYSVVQLTKSNRNNIEKNLVPNVCLLYAQYAYSTISSLDKFNMHIGKKTYDKVTGSKITEWNNSLTFNKEAFNKLNLSNVVPSETIKIFNSENKNIPKEIKWFSSWSKSSNKFEKEINSLYETFDKLTIEINDLLEEKFKYPPKDKLNKLITRTKRIAGINVIASKDERTEQDIIREAIPKNVRKYLGGKWDV